MFDPASIQSLADMPRPLPYVEDFNERLQLGRKRPFDFSFNWLREPAPGLLEGDIGLAIRAAGEAAASYTFEGWFRRELSLDEQSRLRLRVFRRETGELGPSIAVSVSATPSVGLPQEPSELLSAILGLHPLQWLRDLSEKVQSAPEALAGLLPDSTPEAIRRFFEFWDRLGSEEAAALWDAAPDSSRMREAAQGLLAEQPLLEVLVMLKRRVEQFAAAEKMFGSLRDLADYRSLDGWVRSQLEKLLGPVRTERDLTRLLQRITAMGGLQSGE